MGKVWFGSSLPNSGCNRRLAVVMFDQGSMWRGAARPRVSSLSAFRIEICG